MNDDERLEQTFEKLREDDARRAPSFEAVRNRRPRRRSPWAVVVPLASTFAAAAVIVVWCNGREMAAPAPASVVAAASAPGAPAMGGEAAPPELADNAPLDFLLDLPGLHGAPDFDTSLLRGSIR